MKTPAELQQMFYEYADYIKPAYFIEVGAYNAEASILISQKEYKPQVFAYEANPLTYTKNKSHIEQYNITYKNIGITDYTGTGTFYIQKDINESGNNSLLKRTNHTSYDEYTIAVDTLDNQFPNITEKTVLWIDAEGLAWQVLQGSKNLLNNVELILIEVEEYNWWQGQVLHHPVINYLLENNFIFIDRDSEWPAQYNILFKKNKSPKITPL